MSIISNIITDHFTGSFITTDDQALDRLREAAFEVTFTEAENRSIYLSDSLEIIARYPKHEPEPAEVSAYLNGHHLGDWRMTVTVAAILTVRSRLDEQLEQDLAKLQSAINEATEADYEVLSIHTNCPHGWAPHFHEAAWQHGCFYEWKHLDGDMDAYLLKVSLEDGCNVWLDLASNAMTR